MVRDENRKNLQVVLTEEAHAAVTNHAASLGYKITADYLRALIQRDMEQQGESVDFGVDRGGWRGGTKSEETTED